MSAIHSLEERIQYAGFLARLLLVAVPGLLIAALMFGQVHFDVLHNSEVVVVFAAAVCLLIWCLVAALIRVFSGPKRQDFAEPAGSWSWPAEVLFGLFILVGPWPVVAPLVGAWIAFRVMLWVLDADV